MGKISRSFIVRENLRNSQPLVGLLYVAYLIAPKKKFMKGKNNICK